MHVLIAPNAFKHSSSAIDAAEALASGLAASRFAGTWALCPVGDGGDGTGELLSRHLGGVSITVDAHDALGRAVPCRFELVEDGRTAVIELAEASGLRRLDAHELDPLRATSFGTGELMRAALDRGVSEIVLCVGGSATVDCGTGILQALGVGFFDVAGMALTSLPAQLPDLAAIDLSGVDRRITDCALTVVCDVTNPLVGSRGAARVFGPQKGADPEVVRFLEVALERFAEVVGAQTGRDVAGAARGGAAGGVAAGLFGVLDARLSGGIDYFLDRIGFDAALAEADVVITGEGAIDDQTPDGKAPWGVAVRARSQGVFVVGVAGRVPLIAGPGLRSCFDALIPIGHEVMPVEAALRSTGENLRRTGFELGNLLALSGNP